MKALILAAGEGTRLRPLTLECPKPMLPIGDVPLLAYIVKWLRQYGVHQIAMNLHHKPQAVVDYFGDGKKHGVSIEYSIEEELLGTAGAAKKLQNFLDTSFLVIYGDVFTNFDLGRFIRFHAGVRDGSRPDARGSALTLALYRVNNPSECGLIDMDRFGRVRRFVEKPPPEQVFTDLANAGILAVEPEVLDYIPPKTFYDFGHDLLPDLLRRDVPVFGLPLNSEEFLVDIGTPQGYARAQQIRQQQTSLDRQVS
jgi:NDP-sugar pyrophosphorylase family protein